MKLVLGYEERSPLRLKITMEAIVEDLTKLGRALGSNVETGRTLG